MDYFHKSKLFVGLGSQVDDSTLPYSLLAAATTNATLIKPSPGVIVSIHCINFNASPRYLRFYDTNSPPTAGIGIPSRRFGIPGSAVGAGFVLQPVLPMKFLKGIGFTITAAVSDSDATVLTLNDIMLTIEYI